ncbi:hypothetical protein K0B03_02965 [Patescibacteria group bacterium]|nr:hypothetical protein [Patescibacteria group bacterium]
MKSVNLLPKKIKEKKILIDISSTVAFLLVFSAIAISIYYYMENKKYIQDVKTFNAESHALAVKLEEDMNNNRKFVVSELEGNNIKYILSSHPYATHVIADFEGIFTDDVYIEQYSISITDDSVSINFQGIAKDLKSAATQLYIIKDFSKTKDVTMNVFSQKDLDINFSGNIIFDRSMAGYEI